LMVVAVEEAGPGDGGGQRVKGKKEITDGP